MTAHHHWHRVVFGDGRCKTHAAPGCLMADMLADLRCRGHVPSPIGPGAAVKRVTAWGIDLGGGIFTNEPKRDIRLDNLPLSVLDAQVGEIADAVHDLTERRFASGRPYYKLHGRWHCLVMLPRQRVSLLATIETVRGDAARASAAFLDSLRKVAS